MQESFKYIRMSLAGIYSENEISGISYLLLSEITGLNRTGIILNKNTIISDNQRKQLVTFVEQLVQHIPVQYVLGYTWFYDRKFIVDENVLIPRPETEELVDWIKSEFDNQKDISILDIGTGSGCIAVSLKSVFPAAKVSAYDVSEGALSVAQKNADFNNLNVSFQLVDILKTDFLAGKYDVIVSNPPYIPEKEKSEIELHVLDCEPHLALFVPDHDPLIFYRKIAELSIVSLHSGGVLYFEIHRSFGEQTVEMLEEMGFVNVELRKDIFNNPRMIRAQKP